MSDIKISQLNRATSVNNTDLFPISQSLVGGNWESKAVAAENIYKSFGSSTRSLKVCKEGVRDADNIKDAVALAVALSPTQANPVVIKVMTGSYLEDNPISVPEWVSIYSDGGSYSSIIVASNTGNVFVGNGNSVVSGFTIVGTLPNTVAYKSSTATTGIFTYCVMVNCDTAVLCDGGSINTSFIIGLSVTTRFVNVINGGYVLVTSGITTGGDKGFCSSGVGTELYLFSCQADGCTTGISAGQGGYIDAFSCHLEDCNSSIHIGATGSSHIKAMGCIVEDSVINDLYIQSPTARMSYSGHLDSSKFDIVSGAVVNIVADDENIDGGLIVGKASLQGKTSIGYPGAIEAGADIQLNIGDGSAFINDNQGNEIVEYWSYDASAASGSKFTRFANNAGTQLANSSDAIYVGCKFQFPAIRLDVDVAAVLGSADITTEYWNGTTWTEVKVAGYKRSTFARRANRIFQNVETQFVECGVDLYNNGDWQDEINITDEVPDWDNGLPMYPLRFRNNGALTSGMQFTNGLVKPDSFMISTSGFKANFGIYRTHKALYIDSENFSKDVTNPPTYTTLQMSPHVSYDNIPSFTKANAISMISSAFIIPCDVDTSSPLQIFIDGVTTSATAGDIVTTIYIARIDHLNPPTTVPITDAEIGPQVTTTSGVANAFLTVTQDIDISGYDEDDLLLISFARLASDGSDTYTGDYILGDITIKHMAKFV